MNTLDRRTTQVAVDGLLNYETVKFFDNTAHEVQRYEGARKDYVRKAVQVRRASTAVNGIWFPWGSPVALHRKAPGRLLLSGPGGRGPGRS